MPRENGSANARAKWRTTVASLLGARNFARWSHLISYLGIVEAAGVTRTFGI